MRALDRYRHNSETPVPAPSITESHVRVVGFIDEMITTMLGQNTSLNPIVRMLQRMRPALLRDLAQIPADQLETFMVDLGRRMIEAGGGRVPEWSCGFDDADDTVPVPVSTFGYGPGYDGDPDS